tara:strand:+ start:303 stop:938 length:636 start_codon:yes stop_codon:yes gene_type:complete
MLRFRATPTRRSSSYALAVVAAFLLSIVQSHSEGLYRIDPEHSEIGFSIRHLDVGNLRGRFDTFEGQIAMDRRDTSSIKARITIQASSINTHHPGRDAHLREAEFLDVVKHAEIIFESTGVEEIKKGSFVLNGDLSMLGKTLPVSLHCVFSGPRTDPWKRKRIGLSMTANIDRKAYGMLYSKTMRGRTPQVGNTVRAMIEIEAVEQRKKQE